MKTRLAATAFVSVLFASPTLMAAPDWCKGIGQERVDVSTSYALKDDVVWAIPGIVAATCQPDSDAKQQAKEIEAARVAWSQKLEMNDTDWADAAAWSVAQQSSRYPSSMLRPSEEKQRWSEMGPVDQYLALNYDIANNYEGNYLADAFGAKLSEAGRLAYINKICMSSNAKEVQWAMCQPDLDAFDYKKLVSELRADKKHSGYERFLIRLAGYQLLPEKLKERAPEIKAARAKDPAYDKMFQLATAARKEWDTLWKNEAALLELVAQLDDARVTNSRRAYQGCEDKTYAAFRAGVGGVSAKKFAAVPQAEALINYASDLFAVMGNDPKAYLSAVAFYICGAASEKPDPLIRNLGIAFERWPGHRGPRTSAHTAILNAGLELDDRSARIDYPDVHRPWLSQSGSSNGGGFGTIAAIKPQGDKVRIEFAAKLEKQEQCLQSKRTNRITQIRADGSLVYELNCLKWGVVTVDRRSDPQTVKSRYAQGLKPGAVVFTIEDAVIAAWPKPGTATPSMIGGAPVK